MNRSDVAAKKARLAELQAEAARIEAEVDAEELGAAVAGWAKRGYYLTYYATAGVFLGVVAALVSLMFNIIGASYSFPRRSSPSCGSTRRP